MNDGGVLIVGSAGMLGRATVEACRQRNVTARSIDGPRELDVSVADDVRRVLGAEPTAVVINATGYTDVDGAEADPAAADRVNHVGVANLAAVCRDIGALLVHYSTDYVFDGDTDTPYRVDDRPNPVSVYGRSKLAGEQAVAAAGGRHLVIRTSWLFAPYGRNFVRTILDLARTRSTLHVVDDQVGRPTYAPDLAGMTLDLLEAGAGGTFHAANDGQCSWFELAAAIVELAAIDCDVRPCRSSAHPRPAPRPAWSVLDLSTVTAAIGRPRPWPEALAQCVGELTGHRVIER